MVHYRLQQSNGIQTTPPTSNWIYIGGVGWKVCRFSVYMLVLVNEHVCRTSHWELYQVMSHWQQWHKAEYNGHLTGLWKQTDLRRLRAVVAHRNRGHKIVLDGVSCAVSKHGFRKVTCWPWTRCFGWMVGILKDILDPWLTIHDSLVNFPSSHARSTSSWLFWQVWNWCDVHWGIQLKMWKHWGVMAVGRFKCCDLVTK
jgi:hypothetical protein